MSKILAILSSAFFLFCCSTNTLEAMWSLPISTISSTGSNNQQIVIDGFGNAYAIWQECDGTNTNIQCAKLPKNGSWSAPITLSSVPNNITEATPQIAVDPQGDVVAVWVEQDGSKSNVKASVQFSGGLWSMPVIISSLSSHQTPQVALDSEGNAVAVWVAFNGTNNVIQAARLKYGKSWSAPVVISSENVDACSPDVFVDWIGNAVAVWVSQANPNSVIRAASLPYLGPWSTPCTISNISESATEPQVVIDHMCQATAIWKSFADSHFSIQSATLASGRSWSPVVDISTSGADAIQADIAVDFDGNLMAVWVQFVGKRSIIKSASRPAGSTLWSIPSNVSSKSKTAYTPQIAFDDWGNAIAVWYKNKGKGSVVLAAMLPYEKKKWSSSVILSPSGQTSDCPQVAVDPLGYAVVCWTNETSQVIQTTTWNPPVLLKK